MTQLRFILSAALTAAALALTGCAAQDPLAPETADNTGADTIVIGSQAYYSNEIIAEIYAQALEAEGHIVERNFNIGQRDAYMPSIESGEIDLFPEYTGNLLQYYQPDTEATESLEVYAELEATLPEGLTVLDQSPATDQDSYNVTADFAAEHGLESIGDLAAVENLTLGGAPELEQRPYGPTGLEEVYDVTVAFQATGDTTVEELVAGTIQVANVYSADPRIQTEDLVTLTDPEGLFLASNVVPVVNTEIAETVAETINAISAKLSPEDLVALNVRSTEEQESSADIATTWLADNGF